MITTPATPSIETREYLTEFLGTGGMTIVMDWPTKQYLASRGDHPYTDTWKPTNETNAKV